MECPTNIDLKRQPRIFFAGTERQHSHVEHAVHTFQRMRECVLAQHITLNNLNPRVLQKARQVLAPDHLVIDHHLFGSTPKELLCHMRSHESTAARD